MKSKHDKYVTLSQNDKDVLFRHRMGLDKDPENNLKKLDNSGSDNSKRNLEMRDSDNMV